MQSLQRHGTIVRDRHRRAPTHARTRTHSARAHKDTLAHMHRVEIYLPPQAWVLKAFSGILKKSPVGAPEPAEEFLKWVRQIGEVGVEQINRQRGREL